MLVLDREYDETIVIGDDIVIRVLRGSVKLGITAPENVQVDRGEVREEMAAQGSIHKFPEAARSHRKMRATGEGRGDGRDDQNPGRPIDGGAPRFITRRVEP